MDSQELMVRVTRLEYEVEASSFRCWRGLADREAKAHMHRGFAARHYQLMECWQRLQAIFRSREDALDPTEASFVALLLNAYYIIIRGALDNLAWALQYEAGLLPGVDESSRERRCINLFGGQFLRALAIKMPLLHSRLQGRVPWAHELAALRDPAAHRIPLTVPAGVLVSQDQVEEFRRIEEMAGRPLEELGGRTRSSYLAQAHNVGSFQPLFVVEQRGQVETFSLPGQALRDYRRYLAVSRQVIAGLQGHSR